MMGRHLGITRTEERVRELFYWPGIRKTITKHTQLCEVCNHKNSPLNSNPAPLGHITVSQPITFWAMDYMGPLPETSRKNQVVRGICNPRSKSQHSCANSSKPHFFSVWPSSIQIKAKILKAPYCTKYVILWALRKRALQATILSVTDRQSDKTELFMLCYRSLRPIEEMIGICGWIR